MQPFLSSQAVRTSAPTLHHLLELFARVLASQPKLPRSKRGFYQRVWSPFITLWYLIWQRLSLEHTLKAVITDARRGGADALCPTAKPLSGRIRSNATTAYSKARTRLPLHWVKEAYRQMAQALSAGGRTLAPDLPIELLDGSTLRCRPYGNIPKKFPPHRTGHRKCYWCVARVLVSFCAQSGVAMAASIASIHLSEQALAVQMMLQRACAVLYVGDRNFGVWRVVRAAVQSGGHTLVRLTAARAKRLAGSRALKPGLDLALSWTPSARDKVDRGLKSQSVPGRLIVARVHRRGYRPLKLVLFTSLADAQAYPVQRLVKIYGIRWQVELNFRTVKATMGLAQLEVKSADLVQKEFYAGLMAYNLVRGLMNLAARTSGCSPLKLSFTEARTLVGAVLAVIWMSCITRKFRQAHLEWLYQELGQRRLPSRRKPRPAEPRARWYQPRDFPQMHGTRAQARRLLKKANLKG